ncbi:uncharacterized protein LDX57_009309 [Aspergillus melleus]|uniref:uncharacterized protein n=1 Tax=Aspergillus melleus TaxID=138277 RepID=UPI001E8E1DA8|nr:uncharacterized protein LDX57_009309 [Aspergillus melleus]KAH8431653.1 hypothetical protein LDX57_009309 [Aspergillus melleus]
MSTCISLKRPGISLDTSRQPPTRPDKTQYKLIEYVEDLDRYRPGGYHPLTIGDALNNGRYRLVDKLGYGGYSTIWLARDLHRAKYVAVKVLTAETSPCSSEAALIHSLGASPSRPGSEIIPALIDEFWVIGPNGKHRCIVTPPAQMSLFDAKEASTFGLFQPTVARSIIAQLIRGVAFLHSEDVVHGDLHLGNILVQFPESIDSYPPSELYENYGNPEPEAIIRLDNTPLSPSVPTQVFTPGWYGIPSTEIPLGQERIVLSDFGESFNPHQTPRFASKTLPLLQPPEARFSHAPLSFPSDIWTLACTIWEVFGQRPLFEAFRPTADRVTAEQVETLGLLPCEWWEKWDRRVDWFDEEEGGWGSKSRGGGHDGVRRPWDVRFEGWIQAPRAEAGMEQVTESERRAFEAMVRSMLTFRPGERASANDGLHSAWMRDWGQPALAESWGVS